MEIKRKIAIPVIEKRRSPPKIEINEVKAERKSNQVKSVVKSKAIVKKIEKQQAPIIEEVESESEEDDQVGFVGENNFDKIIKDLAKGYDRSKEIQNGEFVKKELEHRYNLIEKVMAVDKARIEDVEEKGYDYLLKEQEKQANRKYKAEAEDLTGTIIMQNSMLTREKRSRYEKEKLRLERKEKDELLAKVKGTYNYEMFNQLFNSWWQYNIVHGPEYRIETTALYKHVEKICYKLKIEAGMIFDFPSRNEFIHDYICTLKGIEKRQIKSANNFTYFIGITLKEELEANEPSNNVKALLDIGTENSKYMPTNTNKEIQQLKKEMKEREEASNKLINSLYETIEQQKKMLNDLSGRFESLVGILAEKEDEQVDKKKIKKITKTDKEYEKMERRYRYLKYQKKGKLTPEEILELEELEEKLGK